MSRQQPERENLWSVGRRWLPWCLGIIFALTIGWVTLIAWDEVARGRHESAVTLGIAVVKEAAPAQPLIVVCAIFIITILDLAGGLAVVTAKFLTDKFIEPRRERLRKQALKEGYEQGMEQGLERGMEQGLERGLEQGLERGMERGLERGLEQGLEQGMEQGLERGMEQGLERGLERGRVEGEEAMLRRWTEWNDRREAAERKGVPFNEPPPGL